MPCFSRYTSTNTTDVAHHVGASTDATWAPHMLDGGSTRATWMPHPADGDAGETSADPLRPTQVPAAFAAESYAVAAARDACRRSADGSTPTPHVAPPTDFRMPAIGGLFIGAIAHSVLSTDLSVAAGALAAGLVLHCQQSEGVGEMREFLSFITNVVLEQGRRYGLFVVFIIFLIRGTVGTPTSSSGTSGHFDAVLDAGEPRRRRRRLHSLRPVTHARLTRTPAPFRRLKGARGRVSRLIPPGSPPPWDTTPPPPPLYITTDDAVISMPSIEMPEPAALGAPRADLLSFEQARQMHLELIAGHEPPRGIPKAITRTLAIVDTGCATSMAPADDFFEPGSLYSAKVNVIGAGGGLTLNQRGTFRYPMESDNHGIFKFKEKDSIKNVNCPYILIAVGRASLEMGAALFMPGYGENGTLAFKGGITVTVHNRKVLALRPLGYKISPAAAPALAATTADIGVPANGDFAYYIGSGPRHEHDIARHASELGVEAFIVFIDIAVAGELHNLLKRPTIASMLVGAKLDRCRGAIVSIRCKSWSAAHLMPKPDGTPGTALRDFPDAIEGILRADGTLPRSVTEGNTETEHITEVCHAIAKHDGFLMVEMPTRRRAGSTLLPHLALEGCERHAHMLDHPAWVQLKKATGAKEIAWDQCPLADVAEDSFIKSSIWLVTPNIFPIMHSLFGGLQCYHPKGTHKQLKGVDADGRFRTAATENYSSGTNRLVARGIQWFLSGTVAGVCESEYAGAPKDASLPIFPAPERRVSFVTPPPASAPTPNPPLRHDWGDLATQRTPAPPAPSPDKEWTLHVLRTTEPPYPVTHARWCEVTASGVDVAALRASHAPVEPHCAGLRRRDVAATAEDFDAFVVSDAGSFGFVAGVIRGKHLARDAVTHHLLHNAFNHSDARVLRFLCNALSDAEPWWATVVEETPCEACITGNASRLGPSGSLPRTEGLVFLDIWHYSIPDIISGCRTVVGVTHAASGKRKSVKVKTKGEAHLAMEIVLAYFQSVGKPITWIHTDNAPELKGSEMVPLARSKSIRITTSVVGRSRQNPQEPSWRAQSTSTRKNLEQSRLPDNFWGPAWDDAEDASDLVPSRTAPHDCRLGRLLSTADKAVKPAGSYRRAFGSLCYPTLAPRLPSGTLVNKMAAQSQRAILLGYSGGRGGAGEGIGFARSQPGYICYLPESNSTVVTDDVRICYDPKTGQGIFPGLARKVGGGWEIPSARIPFATDNAVESDSVVDSDARDIADLTGDEAASTEPALDFAPGFAPEPSRGGGNDDTSPPVADAPSRGGDTAPPPPPLQQPTPPTPRFMVPRSHWPDEECNENYGLGWEITIIQTSGQWVRCKFTQPGPDGTPWEPEWRKRADLLPLTPVADTTYSTDARPDVTHQISRRAAPDAPPPAESTPPVDLPDPTPLPTPLTQEPIPNSRTLPPPGLDGLQEPTRPARERRPVDHLQMDRLGGYATLGLTAMYAAAEGAGFDAASHRMPSEALFVTIESGADRLVQRCMLGLASRRDDATILDIAALSDEIHSEFDALGTGLQRCAMLVADHDDAIAEFGHTAPQTRFIREVYAAAAVAAASEGTPVAALEPLFHGTSMEPGRTHELAALEDVFHEKFDGLLFSLPDDSLNATISAAAKVKSSPDIYTEREMSGPQWDEPKQLERDKFRKLDAYREVAADDPSIKHLKPVESMWTGRRKRADTGDTIKLNARLVARGDLHAKHYQVSSNQTMSPVVRTPSLNGIDAVAVLREQHMVPYDVPGAYLQGDQFATEQILLRPPKEFRSWDERGVEIMWLMLVPLYGQADSGAIWNRTMNEFATGETPKGCGFGRCPQEPCVYSKALSGDDSRVTMPLYVDDGRLYWDPTPAACEAVSADKLRLTERFGIEFGEDDPASDYFLGANRQSSRRDGSKSSATSYIDLMLKRYLPDTDISKFPASWSYTPADESLTPLWESMSSNRPDASADLRLRYGSLFGALLHATKYRPEIMAPLGLLGSCLSFPTQELYDVHLLRVLVYLGRTRSLGITYSKHADNASKLRAFADSNWAVTRSTTGYTIMLAGAGIGSVSRRQHCISMSSCEAELNALAECAIELLHVSATLAFIGHEQDTAIEVFTDNKAAYDLCHRFTSAQNSRHIDRKMFKMRELRGAGIVTVAHVGTEHNPADLFTKILSRQPFEKHRKTVLNLPGDTGAEYGTRARMSKAKTPAG